MKGIDVNFMAFGPKDGGKTYTFIGEKFNINAFRKDSKGIALYAITSIFKALKFMKDKNIKYHIGYSLVEVPDNKDIQISLNESFKGFNNLKDVKQAILEHYKNRKYENSHTIFSVSLVQYRINKKTNQMMKLESKLNFLDFSHTITDKLLKKMDLNPTAKANQCLHEIVNYCQYLDNIVTKAFAGKDRTILLYCTPYLNTEKEIEIMNKMENIIQLFHQIECNVNINYTESSNSTMMKENLDFLKKKLTTYNQNTKINENAKEVINENNENKMSTEAEAVDLDISDDSKNSIDVDTDDSLIDSYLLRSQNAVDNNEVINKKENNIVENNKDTSKKITQTITESTSHRIIPEDLSSKDNANKEISKEEYILKEADANKLNYRNSVDFLEPITEETSQEILKSIQNVEDNKLNNGTTVIEPFITKNFKKTEKQVCYTDPVVTEKRYCEPVVTEEVIQESGRKKRIITINTETITITKRKPSFTSKTIHTTSSSTSTPNILDHTNIITDPIVSSSKSISFDPSISNKSFVTKKTVIKKSNNSKTINEKPIRSTSFKNEISELPESIASSTRSVSNLNDINSSTSIPNLNDINSSTSVPNLNDINSSRSVPSLNGINTPKPVPSINTSPQINSSEDNTKNKTTNKAEKQTLTETYSNT